MVLAAAVLALAAGLSGWLVSSGLSSRPASPVAAGAQAPGFSLPSLWPGGAAVSLSSFRGHPVVLNFFASWCPPCRVELPGLARASRADAGVRFVGVDVGDSAPAARQLVTSSGVSYPVGVDASYRLAGGTYRLFGMPTTVFIAPDGTVVGSVTGRVGAARLDHWLAKLEAQG